jgi:hypothetical protein
MAACCGPFASVPGYTLEDVFLCAQVTLTELPTESDTALCGSMEDCHLFTDETSRSGPVVVGVKQTLQVKCPRCWRFVCDECSNEDAVCERCEEVLERR